MPQLKLAKPAMPGAWYDLSCRISSALAVCGCAQESLPNTDGPLYDRINTTCHLIAAVEDILKLMQQDTHELEQQLKSQLAI